MSADRPRRHLWAGPNDPGADHGWLHPRPEPQSAPPPEPTGPARPPRKSRRRPVATVLAVLALALGGIAVGSHLENNGSGTGKVAAVNLPVVNGTTPVTRENQIYEATSHAVVQIRTGDASGTGFIVDRQGIIVTNAHVVENETTVRIIFDDGLASVEGTVLGKDVSSDLAAIKVNPSDIPKSVHPLALADSDAVKTGDEVLAIGYPLGLDRTATSGIISGIGRQIQAQNGFSIDKILQTDASINPGNSGGPLLDTRGRVVGVNSQIAATAGGGNTGIGFSIPSNTVRAVLPSLVAGKAIARPYLGVSLAATADDSGAQVADVTSGGPGAKANLQGSTSGSSADGDVITALDGKAVHTPDELISALNMKSPGDKITLDVKRGGSSTKVEVTVGERPASLNASSSSSGSTDPNNVQPTTPDQQIDPFSTP